MKKYLSKFNKLEANHYRLIILFQFLLIAAFTLNLAASPKISLNTKALGNTFSQSLQTDVKSCLSLPQEDIVLCAEIVGKKIANEINDPKEQLKACLMFRPYSYVYDCQEELIQ